MAFEIAAEMRQIGKTADFRGLSDGKCLICQKIFRLVEPYFNQIAVRGAAEKLFDFFPYWPSGKAFLSSSLSHNGSTS